MARCGGTCKRQETEAQNVAVTKVTTETKNCDSLANADAQGYVNNDVINDQQGFVDIGDGRCRGDCHCVWNAPPPWPANWTSVPFEWELTLTGTLSCTYKVEGTVDVKVREITGTCYPRVVKGKSSKPR